MNQERRDELVAMAREAGFDKEAEMIASVTPEDEARFDNWLADDANRAKWEAALAEARP